MKNKLKSILAAVAATSVACGVTAVAMPNAAAESADTTSTKYLRTVETDAEGWTFDGFDLVENEHASRTFEYGTFAAGSTAEYRFKSDYIELVGYKGPVGGTVKVEIDGSEKAQVSLVGTTDAYKQTLASYDLDLGWHTIKITSVDADKWHAIDCVRVSLDKQVYEQNYNLALVGDIICSVLAPTGGGNKDLNTIRNEKVYAVGTSAGPMQYDSFHDSGREIFYMGYKYAEEMTFTKLVFQEGATWQNGGWFAEGELKTQVLTVNGWTDVKLNAPTGYPIGDTQSVFGENCETYVFDFEPIKGSAIRIYGMAGGTGNFVSVAQIEVYGSNNAKTLAGGYDYRAATVYEPTTTPVKPDDKPGGDKPNGSGEVKPANNGNNNALAIGLGVGLPVGIIGAAAVLAGTYIYIKRKDNKKNDAGDKPDNK